jgi:hypothetical protein
MVDYPEDEVVKDAGYFDELRRAVKGTQPIALFGTSGLAVHKSIECAQDLELRKQVESATDPDSRERLRTVYFRYHISTTVLSYVTEALPWLSVLIIAMLVSNVTRSLPEATTHRYEIITALIIGSAAIFMFAKAIQVILWRLGSFTIRYLNGMYTRPGTVSRASVPDHRETDKES